ncbi:hypothetical protein K7432_017676, partial [Basidiobolus ranarum]
GYTQNADVFSKKTSALRRSCEEFGDFVYVSAPHSAIPSNDSGLYTPQATSDSLRVWYFTKTEENVVYDKLDESLEFLKDVLNTEGPFDGIIGFSQGAALAGILSGLLEHREGSIFQTCTQPAFRFGVFFGGYKSALPEHGSLFNPPLKCPSLHVIGLYDAVISKERSEELSKCFQSSTVLYHEGGHFVPASPGIKKDCVKFLRQFSEL